MKKTLGRLAGAVLAGALLTLTVSPVALAQEAPVTTTTEAAPTACAGVTAVIVVAFTTTTEVAALPPIAIVAPARKPVPVRVTAVPPAEVPRTGAMLPTVGAGYW